MSGPCPSNGSEFTARNCIAMDAPRRRRRGTPKVARTMEKELKERGLSFGRAGRLRKTGSSGGPFLKPHVPLGTLNICGSDLLSTFNGYARQIWNEQRANYIN